MNSSINCLVRPEEGDKEAHNTGQQRQDEAENEIRVFYTRGRGAETGGAPMAGEAS